MIIGTVILAKIIIAGECERAPRVPNGVIIDITIIRTVLSVGGRWSKDVLTAATANRVGANVVCLTAL